MATKLPSWATTTSPETLSFDQIEQLIRDAGGTAKQALIGAGIAKGVESSGDTQVLAGGTGPARGLFQFEPTTWTEYAPLTPDTGKPVASVADATPYQQAQAFVTDVDKNQGYGSWAPDLGSDYGEDPTAPSATSPVGKYLNSPALTSTVKATAASTSTSASTSTTPSSTTVKLGTVFGLGFDITKAIWIRIGLGVFAIILILVAMSQLTKSSNGAGETAMAVPRYIYGGAIKTKRLAVGAAKVSAK